MKYQEPKKNLEKGLLMSTFKDHKISLISLEIIELIKSMLKYEVMVCFLYLQFFMYILWSLPEASINYGQCLVKFTRIPKILFHTTNKYLGWVGFPHKFTTIRNLRHLWFDSGKVHIFWEGHKILRNLPFTFDCILFAKFCGLLREYEL